MLSSPPKGPFHECKSLTDGSRGARRASRATGRWSRHCPREHGQRYPRAGDGRGGTGEIRPPRNADGHGGRGNRPVYAVSEIRPGESAWPDRDRFVLSAGHGSMLLYALLYLTGYEAMTIEQIKRFRQLGSITAGHPEYGHVPGAETTTGPLGQGLANAVGMAIAEKHLAAEFGDGVVNHKTYVIVSDGDLMEGISQEAIALAGHLKLNKLIVLFDDNGISIDGALSLADSVDQVKRFEAAGWSASRVDGHDPAAISSALEKAQKSDKPVLIACRTTIGFGAPTKARKTSHGSPLGADEIKGARERSAGRPAPFEVPADILKRLACRRHTLESRACRLEQAARRARRQQARRIRAPHARRDFAAGARRRGARGEREASPRRRRKLPRARPANSRSKA